MRSEVKSAVYRDLDDANRHARKLHERGRKAIQICRCNQGHLLTWRENVFAFSFAKREVAYDGSRKARLS